MVIGSADELVEATGSYRKAGATGVLFWDRVAEGLLGSVPAAVKNMGLLEQKVMPHSR